MHRCGSDPTTVELVRETLERIDADPHRAFITIDTDGAMAAAEESDRRRLAGRLLGPLDGATVALKDNIDTAGIRTTLGSRLFADRVPVADAEVVGRLKAAGAIIVGKTNLTELACGTLGTNPWWGDTLNPHDVTRYPGGSSSGSAAAVASGLVPIAVGTDTACSIRQPAAMCGIVGLKPSFGRVSGIGVGVNARTLDHVGPMTSSVRDAATALGAMQHSRLPDPAQRLHTPTGGLRVGVLTGEFVEGCRPDVRTQFEVAVTLVRDLVGRELLGSVQSLDLGLDLATIDTHGTNLGADLFECYGEAIDMAETGMVGAELRSWLGHYGGLASRAYDEALAVQRRTAARVDAAMADYDIVLCPTTRCGAGLVADAHSEPRELRALNCSIWSMTGQPSLSLPFGRCNAGLPLGLLVTGHRSRDDVVLQMAQLLERHRPAEVGRYPG